MSDQEPNKEQRILVVMRKVLTSIVKDTTTPPGMKHPLSDECISDIRQCLGLITARENELSDESGQTQTQRPHFIDELQTTKVVTLDTSGLTKKNDD